MVQRRQLWAAVFVVGWVGAAGAAPCPGNLDALGVSRTLTVTPSDYSRLGQMQYRQTLPLNDHEVVLTFDDGPLPPYTSRVLAALAHECVKATFFMVGRMAAAYPNTARLVAELGHTIGNHSQNHPIHFNVIGEVRAEREIDNGVRAIKAALGSDGTLAPYFRIPGLGRTPAVEKYLQDQSMVVWSSDTVADDWTRISSDQVLQRALRRLEAKGRGILLLHDIQARTAAMVPALLRELKKRHFSIVHVIPGDIPPLPVPPDDSAQVMVASLSPETSGSAARSHSLSNDAESVPAIFAKAHAAEQIAALGHNARKSKSGDPTAKHIRPHKPQKLVQTAILATPNRYRPDALLP